MQYNTNLIKDLEESIISLMQEHIPRLKESSVKNFIKENPDKSHYDKNNVSLFLLDSKDEAKYKKTDNGRKTHICLKLTYMISPLCKNPDTAREIYQGLHVLFSGRKEMRGHELKGMLKAAGNEEIGVLGYKPEKEALQKIVEWTKEANHSLCLFYQIFPLYIPIVEEGYQAVPPEEA